MIPRYDFFSFFTITLIITILISYIVAHFALFDTFLHSCLFTCPSWHEIFMQFVTFDIEDHDKYCVTGHFLNG